MNVRLLDVADHEATEAATWHDAKGRGLGHAFLTELASALEKFADNPLRFPLTLFETAFGETRFALLDRFPHVVVFEVRDDAVLVLAVLHPSRDQTRWTGSG